MGFLSVCVELLQLVHIALAIIGEYTANERGENMPLIIPSSNIALSGNCSFRKPTLAWPGLDRFNDTTLLDTFDAYRALISPVCCLPRHATSFSPSPHWDCKSPCLPYKRDDVSGFPGGGGEKRKRKREETGKLLGSGKQKVLSCHCDGGSLGVGCW